MTGGTERERVTQAQAFVAELNARTMCAHCGAQPIEWHNPEHVLLNRKKYRISTMACSGKRITAIQEELNRCTPLCRRCHMREDGRMKNFLAGHVLTHQVQPAKPCVECGTPSKPLRRGFCTRCASRRWGQALTASRRARGLKRPIGQDNPRARLLDRDIPRIRAMRRFGGISPKKIGLFFGVSRTTVSDILNGIKWKHLDGRDLERQASAEMWRRQGRTGKALVGAPTAHSAARRRD